MYTSHMQKKKKKEIQEMKIKKEINISSQFST